MMGTFGMVLQNQRVLRNRRAVFFVLLFSGFWFSFVNSVRADDWPQWRGAKLNGVSTEKNLPVEWSTTKNVAWKLSLPGLAGASPVVWKDRIFLTSAAKKELLLICVTTSGKELWRRVVSRGNKAIRGDEANPASPSPSTDGTHVWVMMGTGALACYDFDGKEIWKIDLQKKYGKFQMFHGMSSTPVYFDGRLLLQLIHGDGKPATHEAVVVALDGATGKEVWKVSRVTGASNENEHSYASPVLYRHQKQMQLITHGADYTISYDAKTGKEIWRCGGMNPRNDPAKKYHKALRFVASPTASEGMVVIPTAKKGAVFVVRPDLKGDITKNKAGHLWKLARNTPDVPSPLIKDGLVYLCRENGNLICLDGKTGKQIYEKRTEVDRHRASPVYADGKIYLTARNGTISVVKAGRVFKLLSRNKMGETITSSPAISNGTIYLRGWKHLWAIRLPKKK